MTLSSALKGWCPGAFRPMMSGDGLIVRVRPFHARLDRSQIMGLCALAQTYGNGFIDLTNRANLQLRGVQETSLDALIDNLARLDLLDPTPALENRRNILTNPFWQSRDQNWQLSRRLISGLSDLPDLPAKFGFAIDLGTAPLLSEASADIRIEMADTGMIVRADGATRGRPVTFETVMEAVNELAIWFAQHRNENDRRMTQVLTHHALPPLWQTQPPRRGWPTPVPGKMPLGTLLGAPFGQLKAHALAEMINNSTARGIRVTPWRMFLVENDTPIETDAFVSAPGNPLMRADACPGAPHCASATVKTRDVARDLAPHVPGSLHVSGCAKGCARKTAADITLTGCDARFDLVRAGHAWDAPQKTGLAPSDLLTELTNTL